MAKFTFTLNGVLTSAKKIGAEIGAGAGRLGAGIGSGINTSLYSNTPDKDLTYTGDDYIVWDRINTERLKRKLPSLTELGYPRPADAPPPYAPPSEKQAEVFEIEGPPGATEAQAKAVFEKQKKSGSLVGLKPGDVLNAATQAQAGLASAISQLKGKTGLSIPDFGIAELPISDALNAADFVKQQCPSFSLGSLEATDLQAMMAQSAAALGQEADAINAATGIGKFGLDIDQLETTGFIKPGTANAYAKTPAVPNDADLEEARNLKSNAADVAAGKPPSEWNVTPEQVARNRALNNFLTPAAFTGKSGVSSLTSILGDENTQNKIQGDVLKLNFKQLEQTGLTSKITDPAQLAATLQTCNKFGIDTAEKLVNGLEIPNIAEVKTVAKQAEYGKAFAAKFGVTLSTGSPLQTSIKKPVPATGTVNRDTLNASLSSILGNAKIPIPSFIPKTGAAVGTSINQGLYANTADKDLTYKGDDYIVWDRINNERLRRGLTSLTDIGYPRPPET